MTWKDKIEAYVNIEYGFPDKAIWKVTEKEDGTIHIKYEAYAGYDEQLVSAESDIQFYPNEAQYQYIDDIRQTACCLFHEVHDKIERIEQGQKI